MYDGMKAKMLADCFECYYCRDKGNDKDLKCVKLFSGINILHCSTPVCKYFRPTVKYMEYWIKKNKEEELKCLDM